MNCSLERLRCPAIIPMSSSVTPGGKVLQQFAQRVQSINPKALACSSAARTSIRFGFEAILRLRRKRKLACSSLTAFSFQSWRIASWSSDLTSPSTLWNSSQ